MKELNSDKMTHMMCQLFKQDTIWWLEWGEDYRRYFELSEQLHRAMYL